MPEIRVTSDSREYLELADQLRIHHSFTRNGVAETFRTPGYPFFLMLLHQLLGMDTPREIAAAQAVISSLEAVLIFGSSGIGVLSIPSLSWGVLGWGGPIFL